MKRRLRILVIVLLLGMSNHAFQIVVYNGGLTSMHTLRAQGREVHCVERPLFPGVMNTSFFFPLFLCFDMLDESLAHLPAGR